MSFLPAAPGSVVIFDGDSLNTALKRNVALDTFGCKTRFHIDYAKFAKVISNLSNYPISSFVYHLCAKPNLAEALQSEKKTRTKHHFGEQQELFPNEGRIPGKVLDFGKGWGFIRDKAGTEYFVHFSEIEGTGFKNLLAGEHVSFVPIKTEKGCKATQVRHKGLTQEQHTERKRDFVESLQDLGFFVVLHPSPRIKDNSKKIIAAVTVEMLTWAFENKVKELILVTEEDEFSFLVDALREEHSIQTTLVSFRDGKTENLSQTATKIVYVDDFAEHIVSEHRAHQTS